MFRRFLRGAGFIALAMAFHLQAGAAAMLYPATDSHLHYLDFTQCTDGVPELIRQMDAAGVKEAVVFGMPVVKMWSASDPVRPDYYLDTDARAYYFSATDYILAEHLARQPENIRKRFHPFISGINPLDRNAAEYIETLIRLYPGFWEGIGEIMSRHDDLTAFINSEPPRADHPALMDVYRLAAKYRIPVLLHHNISSVSKREPVYVKEMERALKANPDTTFIWAHVGISRRIDVPSLVAEADRLLENYPNLFFDLSWLVYDEHIAVSDASLTKWAALIEKYPDRFMIGSDKVGHWAGYPEEMTKYNRLLEKLRPATAAGLASENIRKRLPETPVIYRP